MDNESPTSSADRAVSTTLKVMLTIGLVGAVLWHVGKRKKPNSKVEPPDSGDDHAADIGQPSSALSVAELQALPAAIKEYRADAKEDNRREEQRLRIEVVATVALIGTLVLTAVGTYLTAKSATATVKQAELLAAQLRAAGADFVIDNVKLIDPLQPGSRVWLECRMRNVGNTTAQAVKADWRVHIGRDPIPPPDLSGPSASVGIVASGQATGCPDAPSVWLDQQAGRLWTEADAQRLARTGERLYLQMFVYYVTVFGQQRYTQLCGYWEGSAITLCGTNNDTVDIDAQGNRSQ